MPRLFRRLLAVVLVLACVAYAGAGIYLKVNEENLVFQPKVLDGDRFNVPPDSLRVQPVRFAAKDGASLAGWVIPPATADSAALWVLVCHGNAGNITYVSRLDFYARLRALGVGVLAYDYRGYGESEQRPINEEGLYLDARAAYEYLRHTRGIPPNRIVIFGHSLGTGVATELAAGNEAAGLVLEDAYTSIPDIGQQRYPLLPVKLIARNRFETINKIDRISMPKLLMSAEDDAVIPFAHGRAVFEKAKQPKQFVTLRGGHIDAFKLDPHYWTSFGTFVQQLAADQATASESPAPAKTGR